MSQGFPWDNLVASGVGALVGASLSAFLNWRFNRNLEVSRKRDAIALFRKRAELDAYQPVQVALAGLHESLVGLSELSRLCGALVSKDRGSVDTIVDLLGLPRGKQVTEAVWALTKDRSELDLPKASALLGEKLSSARSMLTQFMHEYGRHRILFQGLEAGLKSLWHEVDGFLDACVKAEHDLQSTYSHGRSPTRVQWLDELARTFGALAARGSTVVLYVDDLTREFQNLVLAEVAGRAVPLRTCASPDAKVITTEGLKTAAEAGAPVETSAADRPSDIRAGV